MVDVPCLDHLWDGQKDCLDVGQVRCFHEETSRKTTFLEGTSGLSGRCPEVAVEISPWIWGRSLARFHPLVFRECW